MRQEGQSTIEFVLGLILLLSFLFFYFHIAMVFAFGNYVHYVTFMAARAYLSASTSQSDQRQRAVAVIQATVKYNGASDRLPSIAKGYAGNGGTYSDDNVVGLAISNPPQFLPSVKAVSWLEGVRYQFQSRIFLIPFMGFGSAASQDPSNSQNTNMVNLVSESWLSRESSFEECQEVMRLQHGIYDNGC